MTQLRPVYPDMFQEVHDSLLVRLDPRRPVEEWRRLFEPGWSRPEEHVGRALYDGSRMVGFVGLLFAECMLRGRMERLCNVHSWIVLDEYRGDAMYLVLALRKQRRYTVTNMSPNDQVKEIFLRMGFEILEDRVLIMRPPLSPNGFRAPRGSRVASDREAMSSLLDEADARVYRDHAAVGNHLVMETGAGRCYGAYHVRRRRRLRTARFHHISNPAVFVQGLPALRPWLLRRHGVVIVECDPRMLHGLEVPYSFSIAKRFPRLFTSPSLDRFSVPSLYSELLLLDLE
ncbi:MAG: hypothetical protein FIA95_17270 [Gemmatimonadetes bacterium]|nr:hypothetical protein [Gemmatimonadota bacterium]